MGTIGWQSVITEDVPNEKISWKSLPGSTIENEGSIFFRDAGNLGTELDVFISYHAPVGKAGEGLGKLLNPVLKEMVREDIKNFRIYLETGEVPGTEEQPG